MIIKIKFYVLLTSYFEQVKTILMILIDYFGV